MNDNKNDIELAKLPPQALELESVVLGAMMLDKEAFSVAMEIIKPDVFYKEGHRVIAEAMWRLSIKNEVIDILTVTQELLKTKQLDLAGGAFYVTQLTNRIASAANLELHCRLILEKYFRRETIRISAELLQKAYNDSEDVFELLNYAELGISSISNINSNTSTTLREAIKQSEIALEGRVSSFEKGEFVGVPTGFFDLDKLTGGWQKGDLIIIAARPSRGKSALAIHHALSAAKKECPSALFSLEMNTVSIADRTILGESEINYYNYKSGNISPQDWERFNYAKGVLAHLPVHFDDTPMLSISQFRTRARKMKSKHKIEMIIVDYMQLMTTGLDKKSAITNREQEIAFISRSLKGIAKELNVPIIALSQLSRETEKRADKRPKLSDIRESGAIEQDADIVIFPYNPHKDGITGEGGESLEGKVELIIEKHRSGPTESVFVGCNPSMTKFFNKLNN